MIWEGYCDLRPFGREKSVIGECFEEGRKRDVLETMRKRQSMVCAVMMVE